MLNDNMPNVPIRILRVFIKLSNSFSSEISPLLPDQISSNVVLHLLILGKNFHSEKNLAILKKPGEIVTRSGF